MEDGDEAVVRSMKGNTPIGPLLDDAEDFDVVVVSGGDGTVAGAAYRLAGSGVPILPFPAGTANLLVNNLLLPYEPHALAKATREMRTLDFDMGEIRAGEHRFGFSIMAGAGYDATIMHDAQPSKKILGPIAYFQAAVMNAMPRKSHMTLEIDGRVIEHDGLGVMLVNFSKIQFEIPVTHGSDARDGAFDVVVLKAANAFGLIPALIAGIRDRDGEYPSRTDSFAVYRGTDVKVQADPPLQIQYDGELPGVATPFEARVMRGVARFILNDEGMKAFSGNHEV